MLAAQFFERAEGDEFAVMDDADAVGQFFGDVEQVRAHEHSCAALAALLDLALHGAGVDGVQANHRLIDDEDLRIMQQRASDGEALARAVAEILNALPRVAWPKGWIYLLRLHHLFCAV